MGKLLRKLHLQDKLPDDLAAASKQIGKVEDKLKSAQIKELKLKSSVSDAVENLNDLANQIEQVLLAAKKKQLESLARRISGRAPDDPGLRTDAFELQMLKAETDAALKDNKANRAALDTARTKFGEALVARVDSGGDLATDLKNYIEQQFGDDNMTRVNAALAGLDGLKKHPDPRIAGAAKAATAMVAKSALERQKEEGPSTSPRDASRTPNDVLVHLSTVVNNAMGSYGDDVELKRIAAAGRKLFMSHTLDTKKVKLLIADAKVAFERLGEDDLAGLCGTLNGIEQAEGKRGRRRGGRRADAGATERQSVWSGVRHEDGEFAGEESAGGIAGGVWEERGGVRDDAVGRAGQRGGGAVFRRPLHQGGQAAVVGGGAGVRRDREGDERQGGAGEDQAIPEYAADDGAGDHRVLLHDGEDAAGAEEHGS